MSKRREVFRPELDLGAILDGMRLTIEENEGTMAKDKQPRQHRATYASDKRKGGYLIRIAGPNAARFSGRIVPVTRKDGTESDEQLTGLIWSGPDTETGEPVGLYGFEPRPREEQQELVF